MPKPVVGGAVLILFAMMEAGLAFMRDYLQAENYALRAELTGGAGEITWITLVVNMGMGFFIPLILAVVAIPLEYLFHTGRTVIGMALEFVLNVVIVAMRLAANGIHHLGKMLISFYDILIMVPLWIESTIRRIGARGAPSAPASTVKHGSGDTKDDSEGDRYVPGNLARGVAS